MMGRGRLSHYLNRGPEELFDLEADPKNVHNLTGDPAYKSILEAMRRKTEEWQYETDDIWLFRDGVSAITTKEAPGIRPQTAGSL